MDVPTVLARRDELTGHQDDAGQVPWLTERGITLVRGWGRLAGEKRVAVGDAILEARQAVILAGGTRAALPDIDGLADARPWTNREATTAPAAPKSLVVIGGGVVGVEMSHAYASFGSAVTLIEGDPGLLPARRTSSASSSARRSPSRGWTSAKGRAPLLSAARATR